MNCGLLITGLCRVHRNPVRREASAHAASAGFTGFTGLAARVRVVIAGNALSLSPICKLPRARTNNPVTPVNPVKGLTDKGFQAIRVLSFLRTTLIKDAFVAKNSLRDEMPTVAAFIDTLREVFGKEMIDAQIRQGLRGEPVFWASENGRTVGTRVSPDVQLPSYGSDKGGRE